MNQHLPDDSYFIEDDKRSHQTTNERITILSRRRHEVLSSELSNQVRTTYMTDIVQHMHEMESLTMPDVASMDIQHEIQWFMRPYLIDFLVEAHSAFQLLPETFFLTINLLDRYCSRRVVYKRHYQLVGCAALLIAAKYGDRKDRVPLIRELKSMCCSLYDEDMFTQMEWHVLNTLDWVIGHPTVDSFLRIGILDIQTADETTLRHLTWYICDIASYHKEFISKKPSIMATASLVLAQGILGGLNIAEIPYNEVRYTALELSQNLQRPSQVLFRKYASSHFSQVSSIVERFLQEQDAIHRCAASTLSLHKETPDKEPTSDHSYPGTPPMQPNCGNVSHGYMTPPITPDGEYFMNGNCQNCLMTNTCPITPTPSHGQQSSSYRYEYYNDNMQ